MNPEFDMSEWKMGEIAIAAGTKKQINAIT